MSTSRAVSAALLLLVCSLAAVAALALTPHAGSTTGAAPASRVAGTISTRLVLDRFVAVGRRVVGRGTVVSRWRDMHGITTVKRKHFRLTIRAPKHAQQAQTVCQILFLELGDLDLTLAGLHVTLHAFDPNEPVRLNLSADDTHGVLGRLFCQLAQSRAVFGTERTAKLAARQLSKRLHNITFMRARATIYAPDNPGSAESLGTKVPLSMQVDECPVLHLILGPLHLDLLGLVVDLNKIVLDLTAIPGTLLGDIFCQLSPPPPPPPPAPAPAPARVTG
jgi:hypothetical protein